MRRIELDDEMNDDGVNPNDVITANAGTVHVRFEGRSHEIMFDDIHVAFDTPDNEIKAAVTEWIDATEGSLDKFVIERSDNGDMVVRPEAVFGQCII